MTKTVSDIRLDAANDTCSSPDHLVALKIWDGLNSLLSGDPIAHTQMDGWINLPPTTKVDYLTPLDNHHDKKPLLFHLLNIDPIELAFRGEAYTTLMRKTHTTLLAKALLYLAQHEYTAVTERVTNLLHQSVTEILAQATQVGRDVAQSTGAHDAQTSVATMTDNTAYGLAYCELVLLYNNTRKVLAGPTFADAPQSAAALGLLASMKTALFSPR